MFIDASAIVAIVTEEPEAAALADAIESSESSITSAIAIFEAALAISRKRQGGIGSAERDVTEFLQTTGTSIVPVLSADAHEALKAFAVYGKGGGHPAKLNMGDCYAYASARIAGRKLLYKGNDFSHTDIPSARA